MGETLQSVEQLARSLIPDRDSIPLGYFDTYYAPWGNLALLYRPGPGPEPAILQV